MDKSYLINTIFQTLRGAFNLYSGTQEKVKILKMAPTGMAAFNKNGTTINITLGIPKTRGKDIRNLSYKMQCKLSLVYSERNAVITEKISMVSNIWLYQIHCRLSGIFNVSLDIHIAGLTVIFLEDLHKLLPVPEKIFLHLFITIY